jgi:DNA replication and repair protein RecF
MLQKLILRGFRNFESFTLDLAKCDKKVLIIGENGQGKTNLLEAIYLLSVAKSFRVRKMEDLIKRDAQFARVQGVFSQDEDEFQLEVFIDGKIKATKKNDLIIPSNQFIGSATTVLFQPQDINLLYLSPELRRRYLNLLISQIDSEYLRQTITYNKVLKNRNALLARINSESSNAETLKECFFWDEMLASSGAYVSWKRAETVDLINRFIGESYRQISGGDEKITLVYKSGLGPINSTPKEISQQFSLKLLEKRDADIRFKNTSIGPHRDDLDFLVNQFPADKNCSRGEARSLLIALKIAEIEVIKEARGQRPILLLDDVFSELDLSRRHKLLQIIDECQTFISSTDEINFLELKNISKFCIANGSLK